MKKSIWYVLGVVAVCGGVFAVKMWPAYFFPPSERQGERTLSRLIFRESAERLTLVSFTKLTSEKIELGDSSSGYRMDFEIAITFKEPCLWGYFVEDKGKVWWMREFYSFAPTERERLPKYEESDMREGRVGMTNILRSYLNFQRQNGQWVGTIGSIGTVQ